MSDRQAVGLQSLSAALWGERHELEALLAKVVALRLVLQAGEHRFVSACMNQVESSMGELVMRTRVRERVLGEVGDVTTTLGGLSATAPSPLAWAFAEHQTSLATLLGDLDEEVAATRRLARAAREQTLDALSVARSQPGAQGMDELGGVMELELRAQACRGVLLALHDLAPVGLRAFVTGQG